MSALKITGAREEAGFHPDLRGFRLFRLTGKVGTRKVDCGFLWGLSRQSVIRMARFRVSLMEDAR